MRNVQIVLKTNDIPTDIQVSNDVWDYFTPEMPLTSRHDTCHMHHMQRMCKIISRQVKFYILKVLFLTGYVGIILVFGNIHM